MVNSLTGERHDYSAKKHLIHSEFAIPNDAPAWLNRMMAASGHGVSEQFWSFVEMNEKRKDAQFAGEMTLALPLELTHEQNIAMVREYVKELFTNRGIVADWVYHDLKHNPHVHIMSSLRPLTETGFGSKVTPVLDVHGQPMYHADKKIIYRQFTREKTMLLEQREAWSSIQNHYLAMHGFAVTVDHRSYADQGLDIVPTIHRGVHAQAMDERGLASERIQEFVEVKGKALKAIMADPALILREITAQKAVLPHPPILPAASLSNCMNCAIG